MVKSVEDSMKSLTIHNIDNSLLSLLREKAKREDKSINQTVKEIMELSVGIKSQKSVTCNAEFKDLCGVWSENDVREFENATGDFEKIDSEDWY
jgi:plasmid stability protein